jgi:hypothetical protein
MTEVYSVQGLYEQYPQERNEEKKEERRKKKNTKANVPQ